MMPKIKRGFFWTWALATVLLALFAWWQTNRLTNAVAERDEIQRNTVSTLASQAGDLLESAAGQVQDKNFGTAQATAGAAVAMLEAAEPVAEGDLSKEIAARADEATRIRATINEGDPEGSAVDLLKGEAARARQIANTVTAEQQTGN